MSKEYLSRIGVMIILFAVAPACAGTVRAKAREQGNIPEIKKDCAACHTSHEMKQGAVLLKKPLSELCFECHPDRKPPSEHKVDIVPAMKVEKLPLTGGKMTCTTCHDPHKNTYAGMLRMSQRELCFACHKY